MKNQTDPLPKFMAFEVVCCLRLGDSIARHHLMPIALNPQVSQLWIVRHAKIDYGEIPKARYILVSSRFKIWRFIRMIWVCLRLGRRKEVRAFVSFNPLPYGLFSFLSALLNRKAMHFGFIGSDWNLHTKGRWSKLLLPIFRRGDFITTPGRAMVQELLQHGFDEKKVVVSPHGTDLDRFPVANPHPAHYSCIFVGRLIGLKRVDLILQAWARVHQSHPHVRFCVAGDGPLKQQLLGLAEKLAIADAVDFIGHVPDIQTYLADSKIIIIASSSEGFPSSLVEGICSGLVPVCTPVGSIPEVIIDNHNGLIFPDNNHDALADCINRLLDDNQLYERLRKQVIELRPCFSHEKASFVWDKWFRSLETKDGNL
jgi:glycosyltransferase involved in cell wall biosynthesis